MASTVGSSTIPVNEVGAEHYKRGLYKVVMSPCDTDTQTWNYRDRYRATSCYKRIL